MVKRVLAGVGALVVIGAIFGGCAPEQPVSKADKPIEAPKKEEKKTPQIFKAGETVKIGDTELSITSVKLENGDPYVKPKKGKVLILDLAGQNNGNDSWFISNSDFNLYDSEGNKMEEYFSVDEAFFTEEVNKGKKVKAKLAYDVEGKGKYELVYKPNFLLDQEIKWEIEAK